MAEVETLSPWWRRSAIVTIVLCFCVLGWLAKLTYSGAPPIPERVVGPDGAVLFTNADIAAGQQVFLRYGLMENGTIWGHGAYLGPDFSADYLHTLALDAEKTVAERHGFVMQAALRAQPAIDRQRGSRAAPQAESLRPGLEDSHLHRGGGRVLPAADRPVGGIFQRSSEEWRPSARLHQRPCAASPTDLVLCMGGVGFGHGSARTQLLVHQQFSL